MPFLISAVQYGDHFGSGIISSSIRWGIICSSGIIFGPVQILKFYPKTISESVHVEQEENEIQSHFSISEFISFSTFADKQIPQRQIDN